MRMEMSMKKKSLCITVIIIATFTVSCYCQERDLSLHIGDAPTSVTKTFVVKCEGRCNDITASIKVDTGDANLFASEEQPPQIGEKQH